MSGLRVERVPFDEISELHDERRRRATYQIVRDSILGRGLADAYLIRFGGTSIGFGGVWTEHFPGRVMAYYLRPGNRTGAAEAFAELLAVSGADAVEAQTNMPFMLSMLSHFGGPGSVEKLLFADGPGESVTPPDGCSFRARRAGDLGPDGDWVVEARGRVVGAGGILTHYNPPFGDLYMAVAEDSRRSGIGSYLVSELRRICRERGLTPAARCDPSNEASRKTLLRGGMAECGRLMAASVRR